MPATTSPATRWLRPCNTVARPRLRLLCLPHAGGTAHAYRTWPTELPDDVAVLAVQYPGRQDRLAEPPATRIEDLVNPIADALAPYAGEPLVVFGHSMGASVGYELTVELERRHGPVVDLLVASGSIAPHHRDPHQAHTLPDAELLADVKRVNGSFAPLLEAPDLVELLLPTIRADYRLSQTYLRPQALAVQASLLALGGADDPDVSHNDLLSWSAVTAGTFTAQSLPGGHFYLAEHEQATLRALAAHFPR
ncbi:pyochelin biosynthetic protein PchC [Actinokineospora baliensis]|uniref:thioesterase II family protein n=1 Tax=Actinokineospora baliensis TaxID=547056 RepID=UPI001957B4B9|nr:alpha/beta fold hydrolase [Actinokineospora baliensis]MBM7776032.1 pyochelin biosynthetic protein PchC [Actinokineospora baliensis]